MASGKRYLVEHLDPELGTWSALEYESIARECGRSESSDGPASARFWLTSVPAELKVQDGLKVAEKEGLVQLWQQGVEQMSAGQPTSIDGAVPQSRICLLDPRSTTDLSPADADLFDWFLFGGILGDDPPRDRTGELRQKGFPTRRLGAVQMTTDTAVRTTRLVIEHGLGLGLGPAERLPNAPEETEGKKIEWVDMPEIRVDRVESVEMPFRYVKGEDGEPVMAKGMLELIKKDSERGFDGFLADGEEGV